MTLEEVKIFLRIDSDDEDTLITSLIKTSTEIVEEILRYPLSEFNENIPETVKQAIYIVFASLYEARQIGGGNEIKLTDIKIAIRNMLEPYRKQRW